MHADHPRPLRIHLTVERRRERRHEAMLRAAIAEQGARDAAERRRRDRAERRASWGLTLDHVLVVALLAAVAALWVRS